MKQQLEKIAYSNFISNNVTSKFKFFPVEPILSDTSYLTNYVSRLNYQIMGLAFGQNQGNYLDFSNLLGSSMNLSFP